MIDREKDKSVPPDQVLTLDWLVEGFISGFQGGTDRMGRPVGSITSDKRRILNGLMKKITEAKKTIPNALEVSAVEILFMKEGFAKGKCTPDTASWVSIAEDALNTAIEVAPEATAPVPAAVTSEDVAENALKAGLTPAM